MLGPCPKILDPTAVSKVLRTQASKALGQNRAGDWPVQKVVLLTRT